MGLILVIRTEFGTLLHPLDEKLFWRMSLSSMDGHSRYYTDKNTAFFEGAILCFFISYYTDRKTAFGGVRFFLHRMTLSSIEGHSLRAAL